MRRWESTIRRANQAYTDKEYAAALHLNSFAIHLAQTKFEKAFLGDDPDKAIASVLIPYLNIIDVYVTINEIAAANSIFDSGFTFLEIISKRHNSTKQCIAVARGTSHFKREWYLFTKKNNADLTSETISPSHPSTFQPKNSVEQSLTLH